MVNPPGVRWQHLCAVPDDCALSLWVCTLRLWSVSPSCGCGTLGRYHAARRMGNLNDACASSQDRSERPASRRGPRAARRGSTRSLNSPPGARGGRADPGRLTLRRRMSKSRRCTVLYSSILYHLIGHLLFSTLDSVGADRVATTSEVSTCAVGSTTHPRTTRPRRPRPPACTHAPCSLSPLSRSRTISRAPFVLAPPHTALPGRCPRALSLSHA